jgi:hypothetical protein
MRKASAVVLLSIASWPAFAACANNDTFCQNMQNANEVSKRQQQEQDRAQQQRYNQQNGTSQYSGPTLNYNSNAKTPMIGYQKSIK